MAQAGGRERHGDRQRGHGSQGFEVQHHRLHQWDLLIETRFEATTRRSVRRSGLFSLVATLARTT
ncbi:hypothetical protein [Rhodopseudomonas sp. AAP120]|uniref:hypothetical protein n=1 Tax=Rhodopseudomonas sp. AAP120 TaxID=1523430 RepID=UPI0018D01552|nr:hypothetical protein [Rhodopseudomonas sp. AAP120]